jgi:hypothetical protein
MCIYIFIELLSETFFTLADPSGHAVYGVGLRPLGCCDCGFESHWWHGYLYVVNIVGCQV